MRIKNYIGGLLAVVMLASAPTTGIACSCGPKLSPKAALRGAAIVFSGRVKAGRVIKLRFKGASEVEMREFVFEVKEVWKGAVPKNVTIRTAMGGGECGYGFDVGERYLVYAYQEGTQFETDICTRTIAVGSADEDFKHLGPPTKVL